MANLAAPVAKACISSPKEVDCGTFQAGFEKEMLSITQTLLDATGGRGRFDGIVITGGCALNVLANSKIEAGP